MVSDQWSVHGKVLWEGEASAEPKVDRFNSLKLVLGGHWGRGTAEDQGGGGGECWRAEAHPTEEEVEVGHRERGVGERAIASGLKRLYVHSFCECGRIRAA